MTLFTGNNLGIGIVLLLVCLLLSERQLNPIVVCIIHYTGEPHESIVWLLCLCMHDITNTFTVLGILWCPLWISPDQSWHLYVTIHIRRSDTPHAPNIQYIHTSWVWVHLHCKVQTSRSETIRPIILLYPLHPSRWFVTLSYWGSRPCPALCAGTLHSLVPVLQSCWPRRGKQQRKRFWFHHKEDGID